MPKNEASVNRRLSEHLAQVHHRIRPPHLLVEVETGLCDHRASMSSAVLYPETEIIVDQRPTSNCSAAFSTLAAPPDFFSLQSLLCSFTGCFLLVL